MEYKASLKTWFKDLQSHLSVAGAKADWIGLRYSSEKNHRIITRDKLLESNSYGFLQGVMVEVIANGHLGYAGTHQLTTEGIKTAGQQALQQALKLSQHKVSEMTLDQRPLAQGEYLSPGWSTDRLSTEELISRLLKTHEVLKGGDKIVSTHANINLLDAESYYVCSRGSDVRQSWAMVFSDLAATAQEGAVTQRRTDGGWAARGYQTSHEYLNIDELLRRSEKTASQALELLDVEDCPTDTRHLVLAPDQMMLQIHESIGHPLEIDRILGDERNYAGSSFVKLSDFGQLQYGSKKLNVTFDPALEGELASYRFDDGGYEAKKQYLIKEGKLLRGLGGRESEVRSGLAGVANFRSSLWNRAPIDRMANINVEPGDSSFDDIISSTEKGIFMESNRSWSIDDFRNKFQFGCEYARLIEDGKLTKTVRNPNYRGISSPFWNNLDMVGAADTFDFYGTPYCGKGEPNQVIRVGHGSPVCRFKDIEVFGGN